MKIKSILFICPVILRALLLMASVWLVACSNTENSNSGLMPTALIVCNNSGTDYASVTVAALPENNKAPRAFGELAPIPDGIEQYYGRPTRAAPLPDVVEFRLQTLQGQIISRAIRLDALAQQAANVSTPYVVVFRVQPGAVIAPLLEKRR